MFILPLLALLPLALSLDSTTIRSRSIYQLVTDRFALPNATSTPCNPSDRVYCGGTWSGISSKLDYIQGMGFDTIWISPIVSNIGGTTGEGEAYHGYWTLDPGSLNSQFGSENDLKSLISSIHSRGMYIMVDVVVNHVAATSTTTFTPSSAYGPFSTQDDYHPYCPINNYNNQTNVEQCWLGDSSVALADLNTESPTVISYWNNWITQLVSNYSIDAIRIDTAKHIRHSFWPEFASAAGVFNQGEILLGDAEYVGNYQSNGSINPFNYPLYYPLIGAFGGNQTMGDIVSMTTQVRGNFSDAGLAGTFVNNHDNPRFESYTSDTSRIKNAHAYALVTDGIPYVYYGSEAGFTGGNDPDNREPLWPTSYNTTTDMYTFFTRLNQARQAAGNASSTFYTTQMNVTAISPTDLLIAKGPLVSVLTNRGSDGGNHTIPIPSSGTGFAPRTTILETLTCNTYLTDDTGSINVTLVNGAPNVLIAASQRGNICAVKGAAPAGTSAGERTTTAGLGMIALGLGIFASL